MLKDNQKKLVDYEQKRTELYERLRENYFIFQDFVKKGNINIKKKKIQNGKTHYDFDNGSQQYYYNSKNHTFFEEPDFQTEFINQLGQCLQQNITPNLKTSLYSDQMSKRIQSFMILKNDPDTIKNKIISAFKRKLAMLDMKKKKTIIRYSNFIRGSTSSTKSDKYLLSRINLIDQEIIQLQRRINSQKFQLYSIIGEQQQQKNIQKIEYNNNKIKLQIINSKRVERLQLDDSFTESLTNHKQRPVAVNEKGSSIYRMLEDDEMCFSNISREDIEVYMRQRLYENRIKRDLWKYYYETKWIHYTKRYQLIENINQSLNQKRILNQNIWNNYYNIITEHFEKRIVEKYPVSQNEMKQAVQKLFEQMKEVNKQHQEYSNLQYRYDLLPLWPSTTIEQNQLLQKSSDLFLKGITVKQSDIQSLIFKMNVVMSILFENQVEISEYETKEQIISNTDDNNNQDGIMKSNNRQKISQIEESSLKQQIKEILVKKKSIILVEADWIHMLNFNPKYDEYSINVINTLNLPNLIEDSPTKLLIQFLGNRDYDSVRKFISEQTKEIVNSSPDKFFLFIENIKYIDKTHNSISFDLLVDTYQEGLNDKNKPFDTLKSKKLDVKESMKKEHLAAITELFIEQKPSDSALDTSYGFLFLKAAENKRKILNIQNAIRSIERRITYSLIRIFYFLNECKQNNKVDCEFPREIDDEFLVNLNSEKQEEKQNERMNTQPKQSKQNDPLKQKRTKINSFSEAKKFFDEKYLNSIDSSISLGRHDEIIYQNDPKFDDILNNTVPEIHIKGDDKDGLSGYGKYIMYDVCEKDMKKIESRIIRTISYYIERFEKVNRVKDFFTIVDRFTLCHEIFELEGKYQFAKLRLLEQYMQIFEQINDPLENYQLAEIIMNLIHEIPNIDFKSNHFIDSYHANIIRIQTLTALIKNIYIHQISKESTECQQFHQRFQRLSNINHQNFFMFSESNQGGQSLSKSANQQQNLSFMERRQQNRQNILIQNQPNSNNQSNNDGDTINSNSQQKDATKRRTIQYSKTKDIDSTNRSKDNDLWNVPDLYDDYCLDKDMEEVFANIITNDQNKRQQSVPLKQEQSNTSKSNNNTQDDFNNKPMSNNNINNNNINNSSKGESIIINKKFEGGPHYIYTSQHLPTFQFSPSSEIDNFINFYDSCGVIIQIIGILPQIIDDIQQHLPQKSILANQYLQIGLYQNLLDKWNHFDIKSIRNVEDKLICDDENNLESVIQHTVRQLLDIINVNNEEVNIGMNKSSRKQEDITQQADFLMSLDYLTLSSYLSREKILHTHNYKELFLACNMIEFITIRENLLHTLWERRILSKIYKSQYSYFNITINKHSHLYFSNPLDLNSNVGKVVGTSKLKKLVLNQQETTNKKNKKNSLSYFNEIDNSNEQQYKFNEMKSIGQLILMDQLQEFQNIFLYEKMNILRLENCVKLNQYRIDPIKSSELDLSFLLTKKIIIESPYIDIQRLYLNYSNLTQLTTALNQYKQEIAMKMKDRYLFSMMESKDKIRQTFNQKYNECINALTKEYDTPNLDQNKILLIQKHVKSLKQYLVRVMNTDMLGDLNKEWGRIECLHLSRNLKKYLNCIPNIQSYVNMPSSEDKIYENYIYAGQRKKNQKNQSFLKEDNEETTTKNNNNQFEDYKIFIGKNQTINDILTIISDNQILKKEFINDMQQTNTEYSMKSIDPNIRIEVLINKGCLTAVQKQQLLQNYEKNSKIKDKLFYYFMKIEKQMSGKILPDYGRYEYINDEYCGINPLNKLYKQLLQFIQVHFLSIEIGLYNTELKIIQELLLFSQKFEEISPDNEMEYAIKNGKDVSNTLLQYDEIQSAFIKENFYAAQKAKQGSQIKIVSNIIDGIVRKLQSFSNMEESFRKLLLDLSSINNIIYPKKQLQILQKQVTINNNTNNNNINNSQKQNILNINNNQKIITIKEGQEEIKKYSDLLYYKLYHNMIDTFVSQCHSDPETPFAQNFYRLNEILFLKKHKNSLNLNYFNTQFYTHMNQNNQFKFKNSDKAYIRIKKRMFKKTLNEPYLKIKLLISNLPIDFQQYIFIYQKNNNIKSGLSESIFSPIQQLSNQFKTKKLVRTSHLPSVGLNSYTTHNSEYINILMSLKETERFSLAGKIRNFEKEIKPFKIYKNESVTEVKEELNYLSVVVSNKLLVQALSIYKRSINYPIISLQFARYFNLEREQIDKKIQDVKNNYEEYQKKNFIVLNSKLLEPFNMQLLQENQDFDRTYRQLLNICLEKTFLVDEIGLNIMEDCLKVIENEYSVINLKQNVRDAERYKNMINNNGKSTPTPTIATTTTPNTTATTFSRIQANPCFASPLFVDNKTITIPTISKVSFVQGFINRLRNKVSRVDLLSSGFGFVISVNDLEDCVSYLNKSMFQFGEKEIKKRIDSSQYLYDLQNSKIKSQAKQIEAYKSKLSQIKNNQNKHIDALVHERGNNLIYEMGKMQRKQADFQRFLTNIENDVTQEVRKEMNTDLIKLENDKQILRNQFTEFKRLLTVTFTHEIKTSGREMESAMTKKTIDVLNQLNKLQSFALDQQSETMISPKKQFSHKNSTEIRSPSSSIKSSPKEFSQNSQIPQTSTTILQNVSPYQQRTSITKNRNSNYNVSKCEADEDLLTDPVITTKYINKLRDKYETEINQQKLEIMNFKSLHSELVENKKEETIIKKELVNIHNALKEQEKQNKKISNELEILTFEKLKIEKNRDDLMKKVRQLEDQLKYIDKYDGLGEDVQNMIKEREDKISKLTDKEKIMQKTVQTMNLSNKKQLKTLEEKIKIEKNIKNIMITKVDSSNNSSTFPNINYLPQYPESTWQNKQTNQLYYFSSNPQKIIIIKLKNRCQDLYMQNQELQYENEQIIGLLKIFANEVQDSPNMILNQVLVNLYEKVKLIIQQNKQLNQLKNNSMINNKNNLDSQLDLVLSSINKIKSDNKQISLDLLSASDIKSKSNKINPTPPIVSPFNINYNSINRKQYIQTQPDEDNNNNNLKESVINSNNKQIKNISQDLSFLYSSKRSQSRNESPISKLPNHYHRQVSSSSKQQSGTGGGGQGGNKRIVKIIGNYDHLNKTTYQ